jgi:DNA-binding CsgD family transcriptional regulator
MFAHDCKKSKTYASIKPYLDTMLQVGLSFNNLHIQAHATWAYGAHIRPYPNMDEVATYYLLSIQLYEQLPFFDRMYAKYGALAEVLFHTEDYRPSVDYGLKALKGETWIKENYDYSTMIRYLNTLGQGYFKLGMLDSAAYFYRRSKQMAAEKGNTQWVGINASNEGELYLANGDLQKAFNLFEQGYLANKGLDLPIESFSLAGMGQALFKMGETEKGKRLLWQALGAALQSPGKQRWQVAYYRKDALTTLARVHRQQNRPDSFYYYSLEADRLEDSMVKVISLSNLRMAQIKGEVEQYRMQSSQATEKQQRNIMWRNLIIAGIVVAASVIILLLSRQNRILELKRQMAEVKQQAADAEIAAARKQLDLFTHSLHEKTRLLDQLQQQGTTDGSVLHLQMMQDLTRQAILTEDDWQYFRTSFDKIYPSFFILLRQAAPDITMAEQRMAALTLLKINNKEIATILGISPESVRKTRQRLRQRLQLNTQDDLASCLQTLAQAIA